MKFLRATGFYSLKNIYICVTLPVIVFYLLTAFRSFSSNHVEKRESRQADANGEVPIQHLVPQKGEDKPAPGMFTRDMFEKALVSGKRRKTKGDITIGIPTVHRPNIQWYLEQTLNSLIRYSSSADKNVTTIVIFLADIDPNQRIVIDRKLVSKYKQYFDSGFIITIEAPVDFYPSSKELNQEHHNNLGKVRWRVKDNFDYAYLLYFCENISTFYLQLEDDVVTFPNYLEHVRSFIAAMNQKSQHNWFFRGWSCLEFSELGFVGKLVHSYDTHKLAELLVLFYNKLPNDIILLHFNEIMLQYHRYVRKPTIFQHRGLNSSSEKHPLVETLLPVQKRRLAEAEGPEFFLWLERKKRIREKFCQIK